MAQTIVGLGNAKAVKRWSNALAVDTGRESYFTKKMMGRGEEAKTPVQILEHLENDAGDVISYDLSMQLVGAPVEGADVLEGQEEDLKFYTDTVTIDQMRKAASAGDKMSRKRTLHNLRKVAKKRMSEYWARIFDELFFMYLSGARGTNTEFIFGTSYTGCANNSFSAPDSDHILYGGSATSKATITSSDVMDLTLIDRLVSKAKMMGGGTQELPRLQPIRVDGEDRFVFLMNPWQEYSLRTSTSTGQWLDIQKAAMGAEGRKNPVMTGALGMYNKVVLHCHDALIRFTDYGSGTNLAATRALFMGVQAGVIAFGSPGTGLRFDWMEETRDYGDKVYIGSNTIFGVKKCTFNSKDFGLIAADTYAADPG